MDCAFAEKFSDEASAFEKVVGVASEFAVMVEVQS
jgi:hypothetical protein